MENSTNNSTEKAESTSKMSAELYSLSNNF